MNSAPITLESLAVRVTALEHASERNSENHGQLYARIESMEKGYAVVNTNLDNIWTVLREIQSDLKTITDQPRKRMDTIITEAIKYAIIAIFGAITIFK